MSRHPTGFFLGAVALPFALAVLVALTGTPSIALPLAGVVVLGAWWVRGRG